MRDFLNRLHTGLSSLWGRDLFHRRLKLSMTLVAPFLLILVIGLFSSSRPAIQAATRLSSVVDRPQDLADLPFDYQFIGQGQITGGTADEWMIGNVSIRVGGHTEFIDDVHVGDFVVLSGRILQNQVWLADRIQSTQDRQNFFTFDSPLEQVQGGVWQIGGHSLKVDQQTELGENLQIDQILLTTFTALEDGTWVALKIMAFDKFPEGPIAIATETASPTPVVDESNGVIPGLTTQSGARGNGQTVIDKDDGEKGEGNGNEGKGKGVGNKGKGKNKGGKGKDK
jgi:hypothetical protein